jgi:hypothetical protein
LFGADLIFVERAEALAAEAVPVVRANLSWSVLIGWAACFALVAEVIPGAGCSRPGRASGELLRAVAFPS